MPHAPVSEQPWRFWLFAGVSAELDGFSWKIPSSQSWMDAVSSSEGLKARGPRAFALQC